jgi:hypothetical protein
VGDLMDNVILLYGEMAEDNKAIDYSDREAD